MYDKQMLSVYEAHAVYMMSHTDCLRVTTSMTMLQNILDDYVSLLADTLHHLYYLCTCIMCFMSAAGRFIPVQVGEGSVECWGNAVIC